MIAFQPPIPDNATHKTWMAVVVASCEAVLSGMPRTVTTEDGTVHTIVTLKAPTMEELSEVRAYYGKEPTL